MCEIGHQVDICNLLLELLQIYQHIKDHYYAKMNSIEASENEPESSNSNRYSSSLEVSGNRGRPRFQVDRNHINALRQLGFSWTKISCILGISRSTLNRRRTDLGIDNDSNFSEIPDDDLDIFVSHILSLIPNAGELLVRGSIRASGIRVQRRRIRESIWRVDPVVREMSRRYAIQRRVQNITVPNKLWY